MGQSVVVARIHDGEVRQVQFCIWQTIIEGNLKPLFRLTHSIIQARRRVTMRSRSLVSASSSALASFLDLEGDADTHVERCGGLEACIVQRYSQGMLCFKAGDGFVKLVQVDVARAEVVVRSALPRLVANLLCNRQVLRVVLDGPAEVTLRLSSVG